MEANAEDVMLSRYKASAVIATRNRPELVCRAVFSVLRQTLGNIEIIVVIDGPDPATAQALTQFSRYPEVKIEQLPAPVGGAEARNIGVRKASSTWIAFLDDDDEWLPGKIQEQLNLALQKGGSDVVVVSPYIVRRERSDDMIRPRRAPRPAEPFSEYLFKPGCGFQTSTFFTSRSLLLRIPFTTGMKKHQDWDWLLRVSADPAVSLRVTDQALAIWYDFGTVDRVSSTSDWQFSLSWLKNNSALFTRRAYAAFVAKVCLPAAVAQGASWRHLSCLGREFLFGGRPSAASTVMFITKCLLPRPLIHRVRDPLLAAFVRPVRN
jgi:glycosyltransferase involved in cell wall biosynthesis